MNRLHNLPKCNDDMELCHGGWGVGSKSLNYTQQFASICTHPMLHSSNPEPRCITVITANGTRLTNASLSLSHTLQICTEGMSLEFTRCDCFTEMPSTGRATLHRLSSQTSFIYLTLSGSEHPSLPASILQSTPFMFITDHAALAIEMHVLDGDTVDRHELETKEEAGQA